MITSNSDFGKKLIVPGSTKVTIQKSDKFVGFNYDVDYSVVCDFKNIPKEDHLFVLNYLLRK